MSTGDFHMKCSKCGLPYYYQPSDTGMKYQNLCQCNEYPKPDRGWVCPKCGNVYSPTTTGCITCNSAWFKVNITNWESNT